jgi:hypothetical protein
MIFYKTPARSKRRAKELKNKPVECKFIFSRNRIEFANTERFSSKVDVSQSQGSTSFSCKLQYPFKLVDFIVGEARGNGYVGRTFAHHSPSFRFLKHRRPPIFANSSAKATRNFRAFSGETDSSKSMSMSSCRNLRGRGGADTVSTKGANARPNSALFCLGIAVASN